MTENDLFGKVTAVWSASTKSYTSSIDLINALFLNPSTHHRPLWWRQPDPSLIRSGTAQGLHLNLNMMTGALLRSSLAINHSGRNYD